MQQGARGVWAEPKQNISKYVSDDLKQKIKFHNKRTDIFSNDSTYGQISHLQKWDRVG